MNNGNGLLPGGAPGMPQIKTEPELGATGKSVDNRESAIKMK